MANTTKDRVRPVRLLGPQDEQPSVAVALEALDVSGSVALVSAGWQERADEDENGPLGPRMHGRARHLGLYTRAEEVFREDPEVRTVLYERYDRLRELQGLYRLRLEGQLEACRKLLGACDPADPGSLYEPAIADAIRGVQHLDAHHLGRATELDKEIGERINVHGRPSLARHLDELRAELEGCEALLIAGGHVAILLNRLCLFDVLGLAPKQPIVAWSGGAMVLSERIVLFHDSPPQGAGDAEVLAPGIGLVRGLVPLPHASKRLRLDDPARVALFARRFAPDLAVCLDGGESLEGTAGSDVWNISDDARVLQVGGGVGQELPV
ncbi:MAG: hypothetical protein ACI8QC_003311 [Planctomycetota bacterium]|jgi:hypothetical protein